MKGAGRERSCSAPPPPPPPLMTPPPCRSVPRANIPTGPVARVFDIKYYTRDVVRNTAEPTPMGLSAKTAAEHGLSAVVRPDAGSPGMKNPDVMRYDPSGARSAMTTNWAALNAGLEKARPNHLPLFATPVKSKMLRKGWAITHSTPGEC